MGRLTVVDCETLITPDLGQQLRVVTPADDEARERLNPLRVLGTEEFPAANVPMQQAFRRNVHRAEATAWCKWMHQRTS